MKTQSAAPKARRRIRIRLPYVILAVLMGVFAYKFVEKTQEVHRLAAQADSLRVANAQTAQQNARIRQLLPYFQSDEYVAQQARGMLGYTLPGDTLVQSNPVQQPVVRVRAAPPRPAAPPNPIWQQWWDSFFS